MPSPRLDNDLLAFRQARGYSQARLASLAGISRQAYAAIEAGTAVPSTDVALRLASALGQKVEGIFRVPASYAPPTWAFRSGWLGASDRVRLARVAGRVIAYPPSEGERPARQADGVVVARQEDRVGVRLLADRPADPELVVLGCDPSFGIVLDTMRTERGIEMLWNQRGSRAALEALARAEAHVVGVHLEDPESGASNASRVEEIVPFPCTTIPFAVWEQGLVVEAGNPLGIGGVGDLARGDLRFLNREPGSGSRTLLDRRIEAAGVPAEAIPGYLDTRGRGHLAVAEAVASGLADAGIAIRAAGRTYGLDVIPLASERYDLVVPNHFLDLPAVQALIDVLRRPGTRAQVEALGGYDAAGMGQA
jgi:putative molybdopterin biosynthesis protein